ncbi:MAG: DUF6580 family putative transport protein [Terriglobales bacterium]
MLAYLFVVVAVAVRFLPHPLAFTPVGAALLYFGARAPRKHIWFPLALLAASDIYLTRSAYAYPFTLDHLATWAWYAAALWIGGFLRQDARPLRIAGASLASSVTFFIASNFAVWAVWNMYPRTLGGLIQCYVAAVPFARNIPADLLFSAVMFGLGALLAPQPAEDLGRTAAA